eukprot:TRINITY_DN12843_c0_g1_i1.p1 TRINITY_DN12843_c0_g1~~TRINITY_DN12843_c0_g1_i1.p1  ORF type:complete len:300 (+),score=54.25 TRINITY_DN12843_c0_g1_i1:116-901(+)
MHENGFSILTLDEETRTSILEYLETTQAFFQLPQEEKSKFSENEAMKKKNEGYLIVNGVKEYMKLKNGDSKLPNHDPAFKEKFERCWNAFYKIVHTALHIIGKEEMDDGLPYIESKFFDIIEEKMKLRSSVSILHYFPVQTPEGVVEGSVPVVDEDGVNIPSAVHQDTGLFTLILCSDVQGLEVQVNQHPPCLYGKETPEHPFFKVETIATPHQDMFCIMGRKIEIFARQRPSHYQATWHRVHLPYETERYSTLFFADVPQ